MGMLAHLYIYMKYLYTCAYSILCNPYFDIPFNLNIYDKQIGIAFIISCLNDLFSYEISHKLIRL